MWYRRAELGDLHFLRRQIFEIHLGGLDRRVPKPALQRVDVPAGFEPIDGVPVAQMVKLEAAEFDVVGLGPCLYAFDQLANVGAKLA